MDEARPAKVVPTARPYISRRRLWRMKVAQKVRAIPRSPKAVITLGALASVVLAWVIVTVAQ